MGVLVKCGCGGSYTLRDGLAGQLVQCPVCGRQIQVAALIREGCVEAAHEGYRWHEFGDSRLILPRNAVVDAPAERETG